MTTDPLVQAIQRVTPLSAEEQRELLSCRSTPRKFPVHYHLAAPGTPPGVHLLLSGFACKYTMLPNGQRQIVGFVLPGELCDVRSHLTGTVDYSVRTLSAVEAILISHDGLAALLHRSNKLLRSLWLLSAIEDAIMRQWLLNVGHRTAFERVSHLLCELFTRLEAFGLTTQGSCHLPITQADIADAVALSPVHVNRTLMELRRSGLISLRQQRLTIADLPALMNAAGFEPTYLRAHGVADPAQRAGSFPGVDVLRRPDSSPVPSSRFQ